MKKLAFMAVAAAFAVSACEIAQNTVGFIP